VSEGDVAFILDLELHAFGRDAPDRARTGSLGTGPIYPVELVPRRGAKYADPNLRQSEETRRQLDEQPTGRAISRQLDDPTTP
jgi:hypothetical protein